MADLARMFGAGRPETFMGLPRWDAGTKAPAVVLGADACTSYASVGAYCAGAPATIRAAAASYAANLTHMNFDLGGPTFPGLLAADAGDLAQVDGDGEGNRARLYAAVADIVAAGAVPVVLGGDDSVPIPMIAALAPRRIHILQIDAHIDWRNAVDGERLGLSSTMRRASEMDHVAGIVQVGQRGIGSARADDHADALAWGVTFVAGREVAREGIARAVAAVPAGADVVICLDLDALDPAVMPAVIAPTAGGLSVTQVLDLIEGVAAKSRIVAAAMVEFVPDRDPTGVAAATAAQMLTALLGIVARQAA